MALSGRHVMYSAGVVDDGSLLDESYSCMLDGNVTMPLTKTVSSFAKAAEQGRTNGREDVIARRLSSCRRVVLRLQGGRDASSSSTSCGSATAKQALILFSHGGIENP